MYIQPESSSQVAFIAVEPASGRRTIFWHRGSASELPPDRLDREFIASARLLHLDGLKLEASLSAARMARQAGVPVVFDAGTLREGSLDLVALTDYLICSERFFKAFAPDTDVRAGLVRLLALGPRQVAATFGERGSVGFDGRVFHEQKAYSVEVLDTTGAGGRISRSLYFRSAGRLGLAGLHALRLGRGRDEGAEGLGAGPASRICQKSAPSWGLTFQPTRRPVPCSGIFR